MDQTKARARSSTVSAARRRRPPAFRCGSGRAGRGPARHRPAGVSHSPWRLLEHMHIAQWDILEFSRNPQHVSPRFPDGYWPTGDAPADTGTWEHSVKAFRADLQAMCALVAADATDLFAPIPHGEGQTVLREALLLADHNAYHLGQLVILRRRRSALAEDR